MTVTQDEILETLKTVCNAVIGYRLSGEKDFSETNKALIAADRVLGLCGYFGTDAQKAFEKRDANK